MTPFSGVKRILHSATVTLAILLAGCVRSDQPRLIEDATLIAVCRREEKGLVVLEVIRNHHSEPAVAGSVLRPLRPLRANEPSGYTLLYVVREDKKGNDIREIPFDKKGRLLWYGDSYEEIKLRAGSR
jgi:hypothetical protein